ncbi:hypothetical protein KXJ72_14800 [Comamonas aquatica]|nr:hypothetical protein KXJ72_14800 [Comamonas aquatica]
MIKSLWLWARSFILAFAPFIFIFIGLLCFAYGYFFNPSSPSKEYVEKFSFSIGSAIFSGGIFAFILKSAQFMGVFEDSIKRMMIKNEWISSLSSEQTATMMNSLFAAAVKKGFPEISSKLSKDLLENFLPKTSDFYYSDMNRSIQFIKYEKESGVLEYLEDFNLTINPHSIDTNIPYQFKLQYFEDQQPETEPNLENLTINGNCYKSVKKNDSYDEKSKCLSVEINLCGAEKYKIKRTIRRKLRVENDPVMQMTTVRFADGYDLSVHTADTGLAIDVYPIGIDTRNLVLTGQPINNQWYKWTVNQLLFPGDGLTVVIKKP